MTTTKVASLEHQRWYDIWDGLCSCWGAQDSRVVTSETTPPIVRQLCNTAGSSPKEHIPKYCLGCNNTSNDSVV